MAPWLFWSNDEERAQWFFPETAIVSLQDNTVVYIKTHREIKVNMKKGQMLFMKGDCIHAGGSYKNKNYRLHFHVELDIF